MASTEYERDKYLGRIHGKNQFTLVGNTLNAPDINATTITGSTVTGSTALFTTLTASEGFVSGGLTVGNYVQLLPVQNITIPTNQTASYVYTSGSTNDLYFTQYQPGTNFTNTTRLRWLESSIETGLLHGGRLTTVTGSTTFSISAGSGIIVTPNASLVTDPYPTIKYVEWSGFVSQSLPNITTSQITYIALDSSGSIVKSSTPFTNGNFYDYIVLGRILHQTGSVTNGAVTSPVVAYGSVQNKVDFFRAFGSLKLSGHILAASGSTLGLTKEAGTSFSIGRNYTVDPNMPNFVNSTTDGNITVSKIFREYVSGSTFILDTGIGNAGYPEIDPTRRLNSSTGLLVSVPPAKYTVQRVFWFPNSINRAFHVYYGNTEYNSITDAQAGISSELFVEDLYTSTEAIFLGYIIVKSGTTSLLTDALIIQAGLARGIGGVASGGGGGGGGTPTGPAGGDLAGTYPDPTLAVITTASTSGSATEVPVVTIDAKGRVTTMTSAPIQITENQVTNLVTDLSAKVAKAGDTMTGPLVISSSATITGSLIVTGSSIFNNYVGYGQTPQTRIHVFGTASNDIIRSDIGFDLNPVLSPTTSSITLLATAGNINPGLHYYNVTYVTALGETVPYQPAGGVGLVISASAGNQQAILTIPTSSDYRVTARRIYRSKANANYFDQFLVATINDNTTTTYTDNIADASLGSVNAFYRDNTTTKFITYNSSPYFTMGERTVAIGLNAARNMLINPTAYVGGFNVCIGLLAGYNLTSATRIVAIGQSAGQGITTAADSVCIGDGAAASANAGGSVFIGRNAGFAGGGGTVGVGNAAHGSGGSFGAAVGLNANGLTTGDGNTALGYYAGQNITSGTYNITVGCTVSSVQVGGTGQLNIGNVIYGLGMYANRSALSNTPTAGGKIAIGLQTPTAILHLKAGTTAATTAPLKFTSGSLLATPESGSMEYDGTNLYFTTGSVRESISAKVSRSGDTMTGPLNVSLSQNARTAVVVTNNNALSSTEAGFSATTNVGTFFFGAAANASSKAGGMIYTDGPAPFRIFTNNTLRVLVQGSDGEIGIGVTAPTAVLHLKAGTSTAGTAPLKFTSGPLMSTAQAGAVEFLTDKYYATITTGASRKEFALNDTALTSGSIPVATTNGRLTNSNIYSVYNSGTTAGTAGTSVSLKVLTFTTSNEFRFLRLAVRGVYPTGGEAFARTINAAWGSGSMGMFQTGADELGTLMFSGTKLDGATIQTSGSGADIYVKCTDVEGAGGTVTWVVAGEYF